MPIGRWFSTIVAAFLATLAAGALSEHAFAQTPGVQAGGNAYAVDGVEVDASGADAVKAREQGIRDARRKALQMLVDRMVAPEDRARLPQVDDARLESMTRGVEFVNERSAPGRYIATLNVVFAPDQVKAWMSGAGAKTVETVQRPALVVPLWKGQDGVQPLDDRNSWRDAWQQLGSGGAVPVTVMRGDQTDQGVMTPEEAYVGDLSALSRLNARYRVPIIIVATVEGDKAKGTLTVGGLRYDTQTGQRSEIPKVSVPDAGQLSDAAKKMHAKVEEDWRGIATVRRDAQDSLDVVVPIRALADWVQVRQRLSAVPAVKNVSVKQLESDRAELRLDYFGSPEELQRTLAQAGLQLDKDADRWRLQPR
ncbi:MAG: DUF2066 domain-containing protein [Reyranella sp.]|jgi:hypothetical protein|uniref:DUF2066 domain-containing protein n=1 Tax=Reyranella sp. TaxID=1929291 RepID=UPI00095CE704|nr:DUF2066 domain-containing protein [Reyranella sp.]MBN9540418.1 DUF2066 domain-containing protein [Alphaproteobacteria bacterium]MBR2813253.1 DUF2066 domain-containing protein [Reyranella sp.]OJU46422.1 MAG: hypothetical protein BGN99_31445 [Alphaproteobacteria bacterium 65-37]